MSQTDSVGFADDESLHIKPINSTKISQVHNKLFRTNNQNVSQLTSNKCMNVLSQNKLNDNFVINQQFEQYLADDSTNADAVVVSVLGDRRVGKSFLVDSLLTHQIGKVCRIMSKSSQKIINSPAVGNKGRANESRVIYFDCSGEVTNQIFLWNYFLSSVIVYNISGTNSVKQQTSLLQALVFAQSRLDSDADSLSLPHLIIIRRDCEGEYQSRDFVREIQNLGMFEGGITTISMPYPGAAGVSVKELLDVPLKQISVDFTHKIENLHRILKSAKPKILKGNYLTTKILSLTLQPVANGINKERKVCANKVWDELIENLSIGFYNYYLKQYEDELASEFHSQAPCDKYTMYKRLSNTRRKINKKVEGFKTLADDPIFSKYKNKLNNAVKYKENTLKEINQTKSKEINDKFCQKLFKQLDNNNCTKLIGQYCKSDLDDQKSEVLLEKFEKIYDDKSKFTKKQGNNDNNIQEKIQRIERQIQLLERKFKDKSNVITEKSYDYDGKKASIQQKKQTAKKIMQELKNQEVKINPEISKVQQQCQKLNQKIDNDEKELAQLRNQSQHQIKLATKDLDGRLKKEETKLKQLQQRLKLLKNKPDKQKPVAKQKGTCCCQIF